MTFSSDEEIPTPASVTLHFVDRTRKVLHLLEEEQLSEIFGNTGEHNRSHTMMAIHEHDAVRDPSFEPRRIGMVSADFFLFLEPTSEEQVDRGMVSVRRIKERAAGILVEKGGVIDESHVTPKLCRVYHGIFKEFVEQNWPTGTIRPMHEEEIRAFQECHRELEDNHILGDGHEVTVIQCDAQSRLNTVEKRGVERIVKLHQTRTTISTTSEQLQPIDETTTEAIVRNLEWVRQSVRPFFVRCCRTAGVSINLLVQLIIVMHSRQVPRPYGRKPSQEYYTSWLVEDDYVGCHREIRQILLRGSLEFQVYDFILSHAREYLDPAVWSSRQVAKPTWRPSQYLFSTFLTAYSNRYSPLYSFRQKVDTVIAASLLCARHEFLESRKGANRNPFVLLTSRHGFLTQAVQMASNPRVNRRLPQYIEELKTDPQMYEDLVTAVIQIGDFLEHAHSANYEIRRLRASEDFEAREDEWAFLVKDSKLFVETDGCDTAEMYIFLEKLLFPRGPLFDVEDLPELIGRLLPGESSEEDWEMRF